MTLSLDLKNLARSRRASSLQTQSHVAQLLQEHQVNLIADRDAFRVASFHNGRITRPLWDRASPFRKFAVLSKVANRPVLGPLGLDARKVAAQEGFMVYNVTEGENKSKFYEGIIIEEKGGYRVIRRWGALTDKPCVTGRCDGAKFDHDARFWFENIRGAKLELAGHYKKRIRNGYKNAWTHDGPKGQYPIGLKREVGFSWGTQSVAFCIPALKNCLAKLQEAQDRLNASDPVAAGDALEEAAELAQAVGRADSDMGNKIRDNIAHMEGRSGNILDILSMGSMPVPSDLRNWNTALSRLISYINKQMAVCH